VQKINGVYLGWIPPMAEQWEPLFRTIRVPGGYSSEPTQLYETNLKRYPGLELGLKFHPDPLKLPFALSHRTPLAREDYERDARLLNLDYPIPDLFEYIGRTGGLYSGDSFTACPIVEPNDRGKYSYESLLGKFDPEIWKEITATSELKSVTIAGKPKIVTADDRVVGSLLPHFDILKDAISNVKLIGIGERHYLGGGDLLVSFDTPVNMYAHSDFAIAGEVSYV